MRHTGSILIICLNVLIDLQTWVHAYALYRWAYYGSGAIVVHNHPNLEYNHFTIINISINDCVTKWPNDYTTHTIPSPEFTSLW